MTKIQDIRKKTNGGSSKRSINKINKIARHHSATSEGDYFSFWNGRWKGLGWKTGGYHELILRDGTVQLCYNAEVITNGIKNHNSTTYHICVVGNGSFTPEQEETFDERCRFALERFNLSVNDVLGHKEFSGTSTACPCIDMDKVRDRLKGSKTIEAPKTEVKTDVIHNTTYKEIKEGQTMIKKGDKGYIVGIVQLILKSKKHNIVVDEIYGESTAREVGLFQKNKGLKADQVVGSATWAELTGDKGGLFT